MDTAPNVVSEIGELSFEEQARAGQANAIFEKLFEEQGVRVRSWLDFPAWKTYLRGTMDDSQLKEEAKTELEDFAKTFGKYMVIKDEEPASIRHDPVVRERARLANKFYKKICGDLGLSLCFFSGFATWSDYVKGRIGEAEFYEKARGEAERMSARVRAQ